MADDGRAGAAFGHADLSDWVKSTSAKLKPGEEETPDARSCAFWKMRKRYRTSVETRLRLHLSRRRTRRRALRRCCWTRRRRWSSIAAIDSRYADLAGRLRELFEAAQDVGYELQDIADSMRFDPALMEKIADAAGAHRPIGAQVRPESGGRDSLWRGSVQAPSRPFRSGDERIQALKKAPGSRPTAR